MGIKYARKKSETPSVVESDENRLGLRDQAFYGAWGFRF